MASLEGTRIVLGVSGGIAAYKAVEVCRRLVDAGAHVIPVLTDGALHFVGRTTFDALGSERAWTSLWDESRPIPHTHLGQSADLVLVAPATARVLGLYAAGISEDLLLNTLIATRAPVVVCPAMHTEMWEHPAVRDNLARLRSRGVHVVEPGVGRLAGGDVGAGRLAEPADIVAAVEAVLAGSGAPGAAQDLAGLRVLVTAGGTREPIDPVRFIGNRSSGKQGHAVAAEAAARGAKVTLVSTTPPAVPAGIDVVRVETAAEMEQAVLSRADDSDVIVMAAAVADFRPVQAADRKLKKADGAPEVVLEPTADILAALGAQRRPGQTIVGFAAETDDLRANAAAKLARKGIDLIVANDVSAPGVGFEHDTNAVVILDAEGAVTDVPLSDKRAIARSILDAVTHTRSNQ
ncbi:MAG TPA: bifunctional phosphopantothenoylcysteine decarboxylase/phosphopantothenate--cysteine ligase CoaBC [Acidimicrobiales bacterium]|nr:bifunctional phosphopantothenoylcysteine decarboxylase/phosphopantothenate--cysteine ligase CoaBC [Acidimicrobiales bacterium]